MRSFPNEENIIYIPTPDSRLVGLVCQRVEEEVGKGWSHLSAHGGALDLLVHPEMWSSPSYHCNS